MIHGLQRTTTNNYPGFYINQFQRRQKIAGHPLVWQWVLQTSSAQMREGPTLFEGLVLAASGLYELETSVLAGSWDKVSLRLLQEGGLTMNCGAFHLTPMKPEALKPQP